MREKRGQFGEREVWEGQFMRPRRSSALAHGLGVASVVAEEVGELVVEEVEVVAQIVRSHLDWIRTTRT